MKAIRCSEPLPNPLFDHRLPRHQRETLSIVEHGVASTGEHDTFVAKAAGPGWVHEIKWGGYRIGALPKNDVGGVCRYCRGIPSVCLPKFELPPK